MSGRFETVMEGDDMGMSKGLENLDFAVEVLPELLVQSFKLDRFDGDGGSSFLYDDAEIST